jgi:hypothetical protein
VVAGFSSPFELPPSYIARFQKRSGAEHFKIGDRYDLLTGTGEVAITLTTLIGTESDEAIGGDSFLGALATVKDEADLLQSRGYYAVRRHESDSSSVQRGLEQHQLAALFDGPVPLNMQTRIAALLTRRMKRDAPEAIGQEAVAAALAFQVQAFQLAGGRLRYYVRANWTPSARSNAAPGRANAIYALNAWLTPPPSLHILVTEPSEEWPASPPILNVVDLGNGRTGIISHGWTGDGSVVGLWEYRDGVSFSKMRCLQCIDFGE